MNTPPSRSRRTARAVAVVLGALAFGKAIAEPAMPSRPSIVFILADDLGYGDLGCYGGEIPTPHIDSLARDGARLNHYYTGSTCTPTRVSLLTGRYPNRSRDRLLAPLDYLDPRDNHRGLRRDETTVADDLKRAGYATSAIGKWHVGFGEAELRPLSHGFDRFFGYSAGAIDFHTSRYGRFPDLWRDHDKVDVPGYVTDVLSRETVAQLKQFAGGPPFFLYLAHVAPHFGKPWDARTQKAYNAIQPKPEMLARFESISDPVRRLYAATLASLDESVGEILQTLRELGLERDTIVVFSSDNGGVLKLGGSNRPLRDQKSTLFERGIRVPCLVRWPARIAPGTVVDRPAHAIDWRPTFSRLAGITTVGPVDGLPLLPFGDAAQPDDRALFWWEIAAERDGGGETTAVRHGNWKYLREKNGAESLFDLEADPGERTDHAAAQPSRLHELRTRLAAWQRRVSPPTAAVPAEAR
jgi:arylsulfatase A-like enzyme